MTQAKKKVTKLTKAQLRAKFSAMGKKGGPARARKLTKARRREIGRKAIAARWAKTTEGHDVK